MFIVVAVCAECCCDGRASEWVEGGETAVCDGGEVSRVDYSELVWGFSSESKGEKYETRSEAPPSRN